MFKVGDLVQMDNLFCSTRHPPMGTYGIIIHVEDWEDPTIDATVVCADEIVDVDQFVRVHWANHNNHDDQCYMDASLKRIVGA